MPLETASGWCNVTSTSAANCAFTGNGEVLLVNGQTPAFYTAVGPFFNGENPRPQPGQSCSTNGQFRIREHPGAGVVVYLVDDPAASISVVWGPSPPGWPVSALISGSQGGAYTCTFSNPHLDELNRYVMDFVFQRQAGSGGGGEGGDDPPITQ